MAYILLLDTGLFTVTVHLTEFERLDSSIWRSNLSHYFFSIIFPFSSFSSPSLFSFRVATLSLPWFQSHPSPLSRDFSHPFSTFLPLCFTPSCNYYSLFYSLPLPWLYLLLSLPSFLFNLLVTGKLHALQESLCNPSWVSLVHSIFLVLMKSDTIKFQCMTIRDG